MLFVDIGISKDRAISWNIKKKRYQAFVNLEILDLTLELFKIVPRCLITTFS